MSRNAPPDLAGLGLASAALMHDLQSMIGSLREHAAFVVDEVESGHLPLSAARAVLAQCDEVQGLVHDVVSTVSRSQPPAPFDPVACTYAEISRIAQRISPVTLYCQTSLRSGVRLYGRRTLFGRSLGNLLRNAARYARERIEVQLYEEALGGAPGLVLAVEDDGTGVADALRARLFTPGVRDTRGGAGIGLASVAWAAGELGGQVRLAEARTLGGARFELWLPLRTPAEGAPSRGTPQPLAGRTVALIDDDEMVRRSVMRLLAHAGAHVVVMDAERMAGEAGLEELARSAPDVVLLDLHLGNLSGVDVWRRLDLRFPALAQRVAFFSGAAEWGVGDRSLERTGRPVLAKGAEVEELVSELERLIHATPAG